MFHHVVKTGNAFLFHRLVSSIVDVRVHEANGKLHYIQR